MWGSHTVRIATATIEIRRIHVAPSVPASGELDVAVTHSYSLAPREIPSDLVPTDVGEDPLLLVCPRTIRRPTRLADLAGERWIGPTTENCRQTLLLACRTSGFEPRIESTTGDYRLGEQLTAAGFGITLAPSLTLSDRPVPGTARYRLPEVGVRHLTAWRTATNCRSARIDALIEELRRAAASKRARRAA